MKNAKSKSCPETKICLAIKCKNWQEKTFPKADLGS